MKLKHFVILFFLVIVSFKSFSTHIVGGEIYYDCLGGNNYRITLKLYRDCFNGLAPYDNPATIFIFDSTGTFLDSVCVPFPGSVVLPFPISNPCLTPPTNICYEEAIYQTTINLPNLAGGYNLVYQRCCRNGTILNLVNPGDVGSSYVAHVPDPALAVCNSSPHYNNFPPIFLCSGVPLVFDHSATDSDGDSLHYTLCDPFTGLDANCPILGPQASSNCNSPIADPPAYPFVPWLSPYSGSYPMSSSPALAVDPTTGLMTGTPNMIGQWVIGVCVEEYRNGVLLSVNKRDFQFNVVECGIPVASIPTLQPFCFGTPSNFSQTSINAFTYHWDFGETGLTNDTSNLFAPSWTYTSLGTYNVSLIVNPNTLCTDTTIIPVTVYPLPTMTSNNATSICSGNTLNVPLTANTASTFTWLATSNANVTGESTTSQSGSPINNTLTNNTASNQNVLYTVTPTSNPGGCVGNPQTVTVTVNALPVVNTPDQTICNGVSLNLGITSNIASTYTWSATDNTNTTGETTTQQSGNTITDLISNPTGTIQQVVYAVVATSTANGCVAPAQNINVDVIPPPTMIPINDSGLCSGSVFNMPLNASVPSSYTWIATDNTNVSGESTTSQSGSPINNTLTNNSLFNQTVAYIVTPTSLSGGCLGVSDTINAIVYQSPLMTSIPFDSVCDGTAINIALSANMASTFTWVAANNANTTGESTSTQSSATINDVVNNNSAANQNIIYSVTPTSNSEGCVGATQTVTVTVHPAPTVTNSPTIICNGVPLNIAIATDVPATFVWSATNNTNTTGETTTSQTSVNITDLINNPTDTIQQVVYSVVATSTATGCVASSQNINVDVVPPPLMTNLTDSALCSGGLFNVPLQSSVPSNYTWVATDNSNVNGESTVSQSGSPISNTLINSSLSNQTVEYIVTPTSLSGGCLGLPDTINAIVYPGISADFDFDKVPCVSQVTFNDSSIATPTSWLWHFGDGDSSIAQNPSHTYDSIGVYDVQLVVETVNGCTDTAEIQIDFAGPAPVSITTDTSVCLGNSIQLLATGGFAYSWSPANTLSDSSIANPVATPIDTTTYTVMVSTVDNFGDSCSQTVSTTVYAIDPGLYTIDATVDHDTIVAGESTTLHAITDSSLVVIWNPASEVSNQNDFNPSVSPDGTTTFVVSILDSVGCPKIDSITVYVLSNKCEEESVFVPNTFTPNGDGKNDILYVRGNTLKKIYFAVYNRRGELIFETNDLSIGWDGTYGGRIADPDVFAWYLRATCFSNAELTSKGNVTLIR
ncbi:MAG: PKD-like domain-containing protein [Bacteroidia bacterium]